MARRLIRRLLLGLALLIPGLALAHPHAWIDLRVGLVFDDNGQLERMQQAWLIDPTYSHMLLEEMTRDLEGDIGIDEALDRVAERMLENLAAYDYFTELRHDDAELSVPRAENARLSLEDRRLYLRFDLPLAEHELDDANGFTYRVFDPTYWIEVLHDADDVVHIENRQGCEVRIEEARPDPQLMRYAATLERQDRSPVDNLGRYFAETATLQCRNRSD
ncbi:MULTISPECIES: DUF1007 family protein [unclassified Thioalkalivibrio]|uniref:DUF1007 family protein n=1 Tax=unclassified Thioalkalivibrio TaxID=2621013 RepID=UPI0003804B78|nr:MULTISPECIES: DUF1007 family protein [unclassified Thioalkalivibrio]